VLTIADVKLFRYTNLGIPQDLFQTKTALAVVKEIVISYATSSTLRQQGLSKKEAQHCQAFFNSLPVETIYQKIVDGYGCTVDEAQKYVEDFISQASTYLSKTDIEISVISEALRRNPDLIALCKNLLTEEWESEQEEKIAQVSSQLSAVDQLKAEHEAKINELTIKHDQLETELNSLSTKIKEKVALANEVEEKVAARISVARKNAADFICEMAFTSGAKTSVQSETPAEHSNGIQLVRKELDTITGDPITDVDSFEEELAEDLEISGYGTAFATDMAQMISFGICNNVPIIVNENAATIADCIAAMFGTAGAHMTNLPIGESCCVDLCNSISGVATEQHNVFLINGIFDGFSLNAFNTIHQFMSTKSNVILVLALSGISTETLPASVWNRAVYIDGDLGLEGVCSKKLNSFCFDVDFVKDLDVKSLKECRKSIKCFKEVLGNIALLNYAKYMTVFNETIKSSLILRLQIAVASKSTGNSEAIAEAFSNAGVSSEENELIEKYL